MKKILAILLAAMLLFGAALAETAVNFLSDEELQELYDIVTAEMERRGLSAGTPDSIAEDEAAGERLMEFLKLNVVIKSTKNKKNKMKKGKGKA